jgi:hypothetical protein
VGFDCDVNRELVLVHSRISATVHRPAVRSSSRNDSVPRRVERKGYRDNRSILLLKSYFLNDRIACSRKPRQCGQFGRVESRHQQVDWPRRYLSGRCVAEEAEQFGSEGRQFCSKSSQYVRRAAAEAVSNGQREVFDSDLCISQVKTFAQRHLQGLFGSTFPAVDTKGRRTFLAIDRSPYILLGHSDGGKHFGDARVREDAVEDVLRASQFETSPVSFLMPFHKSYTSRPCESFEHTVEYRAVSSN